MSDKFQISFKIFCSLLLFFLSSCSSSVVSTQDAQFQQTYKKYDYCGITTTKQLLGNSCGTACLTSVLNYWNVDIEEQEILKDYPNVNKEGYSVKELQQIATAKSDLQAYAFFMKEDPITQLKKEIFKGRPVICAVKFPYTFYALYDIPIFSTIYRKLLWAIGPRKDHYVVVFGINGIEFLIMDPDYGIISISQKDFEPCWKDKGYAALLCVRESKSL